MGDFVTVGVMGGQQIASVGKIIQVQTSYLQFPLAAANAVVLLAVVLLIIVALNALVDFAQGALMVKPRRPQRKRLLAARDRLRAVRAVPLRPGDHDLRAQLPGSRGRPDLPDARPLAALVRASSGEGWAWSTSARPCAARSPSGAVVMAADRAAFGARPGLAFRKKLAGGDVLFYVTVASLIMPSIIVSLGIGLQFRLLDGGVKWRARGRRRQRHARGLHAPRSACSPRALGAHLTWTLPFGLLIMFAVFNRFNPAYEEAARDQGATPWQSFRHVVLPLIAPSVVGHRHVRLHAQLGRDRALIAGDRRPQHAAARAAGPDDDRDRRRRSTRSAR